VTLHSHFRRYPAGFHRALPAHRSRQAANRAGMDSRNQARWLPHDGAASRRRRPAAHTQRNDWTNRYPSVAGAMYALKVKSCLIDGEITVCDGRGLAVFDPLRHGSQIKTEAVLRRRRLAAHADRGPQAQAGSARAQRRLRPAPVRAPSRPLPKHIELIAVRYVVNKTPDGRPRVTISTPSPSVVPEPQPQPITALPSFPPRQVQS
jgi:hypothetical protein